jgi:hypothetical protein
MRFTAFAPLLLVSFALMGAKKIDLRPVSAPTKGTIVADPYFGFGPPSKNPADYASETSPEMSGKKGMPDRYMGAAPTQVGNMQSSSGLQSYNTGAIYGFGAGAGGAPGRY